MWSRKRIEIYLDFTVNKVIRPKSLLDHEKEKEKCEKSIFFLLIWFEKTFEKGILFSIIVEIFFKNHFITKNTSK